MTQASPSTPPRCAPPCRRWTARRRCPGWSGRSQCSAMPGACRHIRAEGGAADAWMALGFVHAQDRLFQMELTPPPGASAAPRNGSARRRPRPTSSPAALGWRRPAGATPRRSGPRRG
ncbi:penicillin acylase family protein [Dankookia sp. P2]|uniref:penicillin acylase family protein n=1 Tax=Dankookia sp. P2 TaxID=3423955 RepID=UPI003D676271